MCLVDDEPDDDDDDDDNSHGRINVYNNNDNNVRSVFLSN